MDELLKIDQVFDDKYQLLEQLGSGGIGTVYKAMQLDCNRLVALKVLHLGISQDEEYRTRFLREAQALSKLSHTNIVTIYHLGISSTNIPYLAMEYLKGQSLRAVLNAQVRLPVLLALKIIKDAAGALQYTHNEGIIHRDLKPENMILVSQPEANTIKLVDFGLAKLSDQTNKEQKLTNTGELIGTCSYMSPEQCMGKSVDFKTDIYSLTACLYELMLGQKAMQGDTAVGVMYKHINESAPEIKAGQVDRFDPVLNDIISKGMSKQPANRFSSMEEMAKELDAAIIRLQSVNNTKLIKSPIIIVAIALIVAAGAFVSWGHLSKNQNQLTNSQLDKPLKINREQDRVLHQITKLKSRFQKWNDLSAIKTPESQQQFLKDMFALARTLMKSGSQTDLADAEKTYSQGLKFCELHGDKFDKQRIGCMAYKAEAEWKQCDYKSAETDFNKAIELANKNHYDDTINDVLELRISLRLHQRRFAEALTDVRTAHDSFERLVAQTGAITYFLLNEQSLDKDGQPRFDLFQEHIDELVLLVPKTVEESVQLIDLSNCVAGCAIDGEHAREAIKCVTFSESLLANVAPEKQIEFRKQIKNLEFRIAKIRRSPSVIR